MTQETKKVVGVKLESYIPEEGTHVGEKLGRLSKKYSDGTEHPVNDIADYGYPGTARYTAQYDRALTEAKNAGVNLIEINADLLDRMVADKTRSSESEDHE
jgi:hypothetical protein